MLSDAGSIPARSTSRESGEHQSRQLRIGVAGYMVGVMADINSYDPSWDPLPTYREIRAYIREKYGVCVSNLQVSQTKEYCGLSKTEYKGRQAAEGYYVPRLPESKRDIIIAAFRHFGMV